MRQENMTTLCYIEHENSYLMLHRVKKENDMNKEKWMGVGGHFEEGESPEECVLREVMEETGLTLDRMCYRGIVTFVSDEFGTEYMHLFTADAFHGEPITCNEGDLLWVEKEKVNDLHSWEGDRIFLDLIARNEPFFSLKLCYQGNNLVNSVLNGKEIPPKAQS